MVERGERIEHSYYIIEGTVLRHRDDRKGERQLVGLNIPGDFVDLHGFPMKRLDHNTAALGRHGRIQQGGEPQRAGEMACDQLGNGRMRDFGKVNAPWIFRLGQLNAEGRIAHLICEIIERLKFVDLL